MKRSFAAALITALVTLLLLPGAGAQDKKDKFKSSTPEERAQRQTELMKSKLGLTPEQIPKVAAINEKYARQNDPIIKGSQTRPEKARELKQSSEAKDAELKEVLTPDQFQKYLAEKAAMRERLEEKRGR